MNAGPGAVGEELRNSDVETGQGEPALLYQFAATQVGAGLGQEDGPSLLL